ncbi:MAG: alpha/beta hydrolase [Actinobacteria bacterium]|nr:MAG: alpha/beta hydrolase [Actinomycetota bacterium]
MTGTAGVGPPTLEIRTSAGPVRYYEVGQGPALVFVHGLLVNGALWRKVVPLLSDRFRCIVPDWPLGSHHVPMSSAADLSPPGLARTVAEVLGSLDLESATLVGNDTGGAVCQLAAAAHPERIGAMVLSDCDTYENFLPRLFRPLQVAGRVPGGVLVLAQGMRLRAMWRLPIAFGRLIKHDIDADVIDSYFEPCRSNPDVRRDTAKVLRGISSRYTVAAAEQLRSFDRPVLLAWASEDRVFPVGDAERLLADLPQGHLELIEDSYTFTPEDQPGRLAELVAAFASKL